MAAVPQLGRAAGVEPRIAPEAAATQQLYESYSRQLYGFCLHQLGNREEAEDAVQTTFLNAFRGLRRGISPEAESAWLFKIAHNVCLTRQRSSWRRGRVETPGDMQALQDFVAAPQLMGTDELIELQEALAAMPAKQRKAILLREWRGMSYREIADEMELSQAAVETLIFRARRSLAKGLEEAPDRSVWKRLRQGMDVGSALAVLKTLFAGGAAVKAVATATAVTSVGLVTAVPGDEPLRVFPTAVDRPAAAAPVAPQKRTVESRKDAPSFADSLELPSVGATARKLVRLPAPKAKGRGPVLAADPSAPPPPPVSEQHAPQPVAEQPAPAPARGDEHRSDSARTEEPKRDARRDDHPKAEESKGESKRDESPRSEAPKNESNRGESPKAESPRSESKGESKGDSRRDDSPKAEAPKDEGSKNDAPRTEIRKAEAPKDVSSRGESPKSEAPAGDGTRAAPPAAPQASEVRGEESKSGSSRNEGREEGSRPEPLRTTSGPSSDKADDKAERKDEAETKAELKAESKGEAKPETKAETKSDGKGEGKGKKP